MPSALQDFKLRCDTTTTSGLSGSEAYVDCVDGFVSGDSSTSCADACIVNGESKCCAGTQACGSFTGKGESRRVIHSCIGTLLFTNHL